MERMSTEIPILYNEIKKEFNKAMANANGGEFVERPKTLSILSKRKREFVQNTRLQNKTSIEQLNKESDELCDTYPISPSKAKDLILFSWITEERLSNEGSVFNNKPFNFALERYEISQKDKNLIESSSLAVIEELRNIGRENLKDKLSFLPLNPVEEMFENLNLSPNAARLDYILTKKGPKLIEINSQWVDAISALSGFQKVFGQTSEYKPIDVFSEIINRKRVAIIDINQSTAISKSTGAIEELNSLARKLLNTRKPPVVCEVIDPEKTSLRYLNKFDYYYLNCDPRYFRFEIPDWLTYITDKAKRGSATIFPNWRPLLDKKYILSMMSNECIAPTTPLTKEAYLDCDSPLVLKGDGYSLNSVVTSFDSNFKEMLGYAMEEPNAYVVQPYIESVIINSWVFDTDKRKVKFLKDAFTKLNVWVLGNRVVGMLLTLSDSPLISDKGYNCVPIFRKDNI
ncbi:MAG: hypothetical protein Q8P91_02495 [bacterium]|nr:hypothetical protein [bacterium]